MKTVLIFIQINWYDFSNRGLHGAISQTFNADVLTIGYFYLQSSSTAPQTPFCINMQDNRYFSSVSYNMKRTLINQVLPFYQ